MSTSVWTGVAAVQGRRGSPRLPSFRRAQPRAMLFQIRGRRHHGDHVNLTAGSPDRRGWLASATDATSGITARMPAPRCVHAQPFFSSCRRGVTTEIEVIFKSKRQRLSRRKSWLFRSFIGERPVVAVRSLVVVINPDEQKPLLRPHLLVIIDFGRSPIEIGAGPQSWRALIGAKPTRKVSPSRRVTSSLRPFCFCCLASLDQWPLRLQAGSCRS